MEKRNVSILAGLIAVVLATSGLSILLTRRAHADDANSIGVFDVQVDKHGREWVDIVFDKPVEIARAGEIVDPPPATIDPAITGVWRWRANNVLRFAPAGGFSIGTEYKIELKKARLVAAGQRFRGDGDVKVVIDRFLIERITTAEEPLPAAPRQVVLRGEIHFNYSVNPEILVSRVSLVDGGERQPVEILAEGGWNTVVAFRSKPLPKARDERVIKIVVDKSVATSAGGQTLDRDFVSEVKLGSAEKLAVRDVQPTSSDDSDATLKIEFSSALNPDVAAKFVTIKPAVKTHVSTQGNELLFVGPFAAGSTYDVVVGKGLPAIDNATLEEAYSTSVTFPDLKASLEFQSEGMFLSASGFQSVAIESVNVDKAVLAIDRVYRNNVFHLLANDYWYPNHYYERDDEEEETDEGVQYVSPISHAMGDPIARKKLTFRKAHNRKVVTTVSLEPYVSKHEPGLYRVTLAQEHGSNAARWILITDLGIVAKRGSDHLTVWVSSFKDLDAVSGASVALISDQNQLLGSGHTDARGLWTVKLPKKKQPFMITVQRGGDFSFLVFGKTEIDLSPFDVAGDRIGASGYSAYLYGERDIYRPGESVEGLAVVRDRALAAPPELPLVAKHFDGNDERESVRLTMTDGGIAPFTLKLPPYARTGHHRLDLIAGKDVIGSYFFQVEEFVPDRIKVEIKPKTKDAAPGDDLAVDVSSVYLFGPPAANLAVDTRVRLVPSVFSPEGFEQFSFTNGDRKFDPREIANDSGTLDAKGVHELTVPIPPRMVVPSSLEAIVSTRVQEQGGRGVSAVAHVPVHPWKRYVGVRREGEDAYPKPGKPVTFEWVSLSKDGKPAASGALRAELFQDQWHTVLRKTANGGYDYESTRDSVLLSTKAIPPGASRGTFTFVASGYRTYRVVVSDPESGASAQIDFCAGGWGYSPWAMKNPGRLQLDLDKAEYAPGDVATLQVRAPFSGKLLVTVERDEVTYTAIETLAGNTATVRVPLAAELRPNAFITATVVRAAKDLEPGEAGRAFGAIAVNVDREANRLHPEIKAPAEMRSRRKLPVEVTTEPNAVVTIAAVDEGILQLIAQRTPDPFAHFYRRLALDVQSYDIFALLLPEVRPNGKKVAGGGEGKDAGAQYVRADSIRRARPVAYWSGALRADASGRVKFTFDVPDFNGGVRVMAVAHRGRRFGSSEAMVRVHDPLVLTATAPRFVAVGDQVSVPVTLRNDTGRAGNFVVNAQKLDIANSTEKTIYLPLKTPPEPGAIDLAINANGNGESAATKLTIPVRWPLPPESDETHGFFPQPSATFADDAKTFMPASVERTLVVSPIPAVQFRGKLIYLLHYPYGCVEQTTSSVFPLLYFGDLAKELDPDAFANNESAAMVREGVRRLGTMQTISGGFSMWPYGSAPWPWGSTYATHFLVEARRAGHQVEPGIYDRALRYVGDDAKAKMQAGSGDLERVVYDLYILARAGKADVGMMDYIREHKLAELDTSSKALLAAAYAAAGNPRMIDVLLANVSDVDAIARQSGDNLSSMVRNRALLLLALLDARPDDPRIPRLVERLTRDAGDPWWSTQESSMALIAIGQFFRRQRASATYSGAVYAGSKMVGTFTASTAVFRNIKSTAPLRVTFNAGYKPGAAYYSLVTRGVRNVASFKPTSDGIKVSRELLTRDGKPLDPAGVRQGDLLVCVTHVESTNGRLDNVVVQNLIPAGLEVENPRLATTESFTWITGQMSACTNTDIRDDQVLYFVELPASGSLTFYTLLRAVTPGVYLHPPVYAEAMYVRANHAVGERSMLIVRTR